MKDIKEYLPKISTIVIGLIVAQIKYLFELMGLFKIIPWLMGNIPLEITIDLISTCIVMYGIYGVLKVRFRHELADMERSKTDFKSTQQAFIDQTQQNIQLLLLLKYAVIPSLDKEKVLENIKNSVGLDAKTLSDMGIDEDIVKVVAEKQNNAIADSIEANQEREKKRADNLRKEHP